MLNQAYNYIEFSPSRWSCAADILISHLAEVAEYMGRHMYPPELSVTEMLRREVIPSELF